MTYNAITNTSNGGLLRWGGSDFLNDGAFDGSLETYTADVGHQIQGLLFRYHKIVVDPEDSQASVLAEMTQNEKDIIDLSVISNLNIITNYYLPIYPKGEQEELSSNGAINLTSHSTRLDVSGGATMTFEDGILNGTKKKIFNDNAQDAVIALSLDQSVSSFVSINIANNGKAELFWDEKGGFWAINEEKNLTKNL